MSAPISANGEPTITSRDQLKAENDVTSAFKSFLMNAGSSDGITLDRDLHTAWLTRGLQSLPTNFSGLDASRPWFVFWISHAMEVLGVYDEKVWAPQVASFLAACQHPAGGFGGGPMQLAHLAPTYAATAALIVAGDEVAYRAIDREQIYRFLLRMKCPEGGFKMHDEGETDMRGTYCALAVASMLHIITDELSEGVAEYISRCQTFEGGIAGEMGLEAHGGYSYCGLSALCIIGKADALDLHAFLNWVSHRQMASEGGFQGRTNKLVDSCYSFWQGAIFPLIHEAFRQGGTKVALPETHCWFPPQPLQTYVFLACQHHSGGLKDKPGKSADFYHTCYSLSGVAASQYGLDGTPNIVGSSANQLERIDFFYNVCLEKAERKSAYFDKLPPLEIDGKKIISREGEGAAIGRKHLLARSKS